MYRIAILDEDKAYLERLISFLKEHYGKSFEINAGISLTDMNTDVIQCDALFFGDDVAVDTALFPANIAIGYLTEKSETDERYINKYQSMEQIYRRMLKLCEGGRDKDTNVRNTVTKQRIQKAQMAAGSKMKAETVTDNSETFRVYYINEDQVDGLALRMLAGNRIKGLFQTEYRDGGVRVHITGMKSLYEYVRENNSPRGKEQLLKFLGDMIATARSLEEYMLSADRLMLDPREIYVNQAEDRVLVPYIPVKSDAPQDSRLFLEKIKNLCESMLEGISKERVDVSAAKEEVGQSDSLQKTVGKSAAELASPPKKADRPDNLQKKADEGADRPDNLQKKAKADPRLKESTKTLRKAVRPYIIRKRTKEKIIVDRNPFKLGKDDSCVDYCIKDNPAVSRNHADIVRKADGFYLVDKGSLNHTFVNGKKLVDDEQRKLEDGCLMQLANEVFEFRTN